MAGPFKWFRACLFAIATAIAIGYTPQTLAAGANGNYKFTNATGVLSIAGESISLPSSALKAGFFKTATLPVRSNKIPIYTDNWTASLGNELERMGLSGTISITGPKNLPLVQSGSIYTGTTTRPMTVTLTGNYMGTDVSLTLKIKAKATVKGRIMVVKCPVTGSVMGMPIKGTITMTARK